MCAWTIVLALMLVESTSFDNRFGPGPNAPCEQRAKIGVEGLEQCCPLAGEVR